MPYFLRRLPDDDDDDDEREALARKCDVAYVPKQATNRKNKKKTEKELIARDICSKHLKTLNPNS